MVYADGFEIGGTELARSVQGSPTILGAVGSPVSRSGEFSLRLNPAGTQEQYETFAAFGSGGILGNGSSNHYLFHVGVKFSDLAPGTEYAFASIIQNGNVVATLVLEGDGDLRIDDEQSSGILTVSTPFTVNEYSVIEMAFQLTTTGAWELWVDGDSKGSGTDDFFAVSANLDGILFGGAGSGDGNAEFDDFILVGHSSTLQGNNIKPSQVFPYQWGEQTSGGASSADANLTTNDDALTIAGPSFPFFWPLSAQVPFTTSDFCGWSGNPEDGARRFDKDRHGAEGSGHTGGPAEGSLSNWAGYDVTGTIHAAMWLLIAQRGTGGGADNHFMWYGEGSQDPINSFNMSTIANSTDTFRAVISDLTGPVPTSDQVFAMGAGAAAAQDIEMREAVAFIIHTPFVQPPDVFPLLPYKKPENTLLRM